MNPCYPDLPVLGIDVSKLTFDACLLSCEGSKATAQFSNDPKGFAQLDGWLKARGVAKVLSGLEATGPYGVSLLWHLHAKGHVSCQLNPRRIKDYARSQGRRVKTDRTDAALIASYLNTSAWLMPWQPPAQALSDLQALVRRRQDLVGALQAERNRLHANPSKIITASLQRHIKQLDKEVAAINQAIELHLLAHAQVQQDERLLRSIDGIGRMTAVTILSEVPAISAFARGRDVAAFAGLTPCLMQSGTSVRRRGRMSKEGSALLRKMLYMAALQAIKRPNNAFHKVYQAFVARVKAKMCAIGAIMHKLIRVAFGVLKHQTPFVPSLAKI
jgi:transposase